MFNNIFKKVTCVVLILAISLGFAVPVVAIADERSSTTYCLDDLTIEYRIISSWDNNQHISITLTNTGEQNIENWMLAYDFCGKIQGIWNEIIKNKSAYFVC